VRFRTAGVSASLYALKQQTTISPVVSDRSWLD
jgi:hypothetical protein